MRNAKALSGSHAEMRVAADCIRRGYGVSIPWGHANRYDLIVDRRGQLLRVQVKAARIVEGAIMVKVCSTYHGVPTVYSGRDVDYIAAYVEEMDRVFYVPIGMLASHAYAVSLRVRPSKNNQKRHTRDAEEFAAI